MALAGIDAKSLTTIDGLEEDLQWALAIAICEEFVVIEQRILAFFNEERAAGRLPPSGSSELFYMEEVKHIRFFRRMADGLKAKRPDIVARLDAHIIESLKTAWWYNNDVGNYPSAAIYHYVCWLHFLW